MRESPLESWAVSWARFRGIVVAKLTSADGIPDRIFFVPGGKPVVVEFKAKGKKGERSRAVTQPWYQKRLTELGYEVRSCDTKEQFRLVMKRYEKCRPT